MHAKLRKTPGSANYVLCTYRPLIDAHRPRGGKPVDLRRIVDGIRWVLHSKARWRDMPAIYGKSTTSWRWYNKWREDGTWEAAEASIQRR